MANTDIEIIYIDAQQNVIQNYFSYIENCNIKKFLEQNNIYEKIPELLDLDFGIFGKLKAADYILRPNDRIEFLRQLQQDPKDRRRYKAGKIKN
jgi:putative ubiquitin-RnfH superfamily antitoxin RatB of RatAB toxin-antitoxin module